MAIPSPIKTEYISLWYDTILYPYRDGKPIQATISEIRDKGFLLDIGCGITAFWDYPKKYMKGQKVGDEVTVSIMSLFDYKPRKHFQVSIYPPDLTEMKIEYIKNSIQDKKTDVFIFNTEIVMDFPQLIQYIAELKKQIIIPYNVLEELDGLKDSDDEEKSYKAREGLKAINEWMDSIKFESPSKTELPYGLDNKKNDNLIISVAQTKKDNNPILITKDIGVIVKAKTLNITTWDCTKDME